MTVLALSFLLSLSSIKYLKIDESDLNISIGNINDIYVNIKSTYP